ncbi:MAG: aspartyl-tRNA(Asn)/glutamyl-tRNA(Gln) amidotransferase subunit A [Luteibaculaceae bacterium]
MNLACFTSLRKGLSEGDFTVQTLVEKYIQNINNGAHLGAFLEVFEDEAMQRAQEIQEKFAQGNAGRLAGMVIALKDNICYQGHGVTGSSKILEGFESVFSATVVDRLLKEDAIIIGRTNCDEFAMGSSNENSAYGNVKNPIQPEYVPGGSSGGSAAAVAADMCTVALGSDTGGSIRQPAAFCGIVGVKPTYGRVSRYGLLAYASSFDQIGPMSKSLADSALVFDVIAGKDPMDSTSSSKANDGVSPIQVTANKKKFAVIKEAVNHPGVSAAVKTVFSQKLEALKSAGHEISEISMDLLDTLVPTYYVLTTAEASSNLARYDGIHFGYRSKEAAGVDGTYLKSRSEGFGPEVKRRIMLGTFVLSSGYYDAYYTKAQKVRRLMRDETNAVLEQYDALLTPTSPHGAFKIGEKSDDPIALYLEDIFTVQANLAGIPAISIPMGKNENGLPLGLQIMTKHFSEKEMFSIAQEILEL